MFFLGEDIEDQLGKTPFTRRCTKDEIEEKLFERRSDLFSGLSMVFLIQQASILKDMEAKKLAHLVIVKITGLICIR